MNRLNASENNAKIHDVAEFSVGASRLHMKPITASYYILCTSERKRSVIYYFNGISNIMMTKLFVIMTSDSVLKSFLKA